MNFQNYWEIASIRFLHYQSYLYLRTAPEFSYLRTWFKAIFYTWCSFEQMSSLRMLVMSDDEINSDKCYTQNSLWGPKLKTTG